MVGRRSPKSLVRVRFLPPVLDRKAILFFAVFLQTKSTPKSAFMLTQRELIRCHAQIRPNFIPIHSESEKQRIDLFRMWVVDESL